MEKWFEENRELLIKELKFKEWIGYNKMYLEYIEKKFGGSAYSKRGFCKIRKRLRL